MNLTSRNEMTVAFLCVFGYSVTEYDQLYLMLSCWCSIDLVMIFSFVSPLYNDPHEHSNLYRVAIWY